MRHNRRLSISALLLVSAACASSTPVPPSMGSVDRVLMSDDGTMINWTVNESMRAVIAAPPTRVWSALAAAYGQLGIDPAVADRPSGLYGNPSFSFPANVRDHQSSHWFSCGSGLNGALGPGGRLTANVQSVISPNANGTTTLVTHVSGRMRSNEGTSSASITCGSTGAIEQYLKSEVTRLLAP